MSAPLPTASCEAPAGSAVAAPSPASWLQTDAGVALTCAPALVALLTAGVVMGTPTAGAVAAGAAVSVGFGAYKRICGSALVVMAVTAAGMSVSTVVGTLAGQHWAALILAVALWGFGTALLPVVKPELGWVGQQCTIFLMIAGAFPGPVEQAAQRALLVLGGSALQFICVAALRLLVGQWPHPIHVGELAEAARNAWKVLLKEIRSVSPTTRQALRLAVLMSAAVALWRYLQLPNGYWMAMTVLLLVRPDLRGTSFRAVERILGTVVGAILATVLVYELPAVNAPWPLAALTGCFALLALGLQQNNRIGRYHLSFAGSYALFAVCLTAYVVFLLDYGGLNVRSVAANRVLLTVLGGLFALLMHVPLYGFTVRTKQEEAGPQAN